MSRRPFSADSVNGRIYAIGGDLGGRNSHLRILEEYNTATDTWTEKADMPTARWGLVASMVNGYIYAIGGWLEDPPGPILSDPCPRPPAYRGQLNLAIDQPLCGSF